MLKLQKYLTRLVNFNEKGSTIILFCWKVNVSKVNDLKGKYFYDFTRLICCLLVLPILYLGYFSKNKAAVEQIVFYKFVN